MIREVLAVVICLLVLPACSHPKGRQEGCCFFMAGNAWERRMDVRLAFTSMPVRCSHWLFPRCIFRVISIQRS